MNSNESQPKKVVVVVDRLGGLTQAKPITKIGLHTNGRLEIVALLI